MVRLSAGHLAMLPCVLCGIGVLACAGRIVVNAGAPDVRADPGPPTPAEPPTATAPAVRYKPYAAALDRVLRQSASVEKELGKRDWKELREETEDWQKYVWRLAGAADTSDEPARLRELCDELLIHTDAMRRAVRAQDAAAFERAIDAAAPVLNRLSGEFPLTEPAAQPADVNRTPV